MPYAQTYCALCLMPVAGQTRKSVAALTSLRRICEEHLAGRYRVEVIDLLENPQQA